MCGIAGIIAPAGAPPVEPGVARRMNDRQAHRGPDGEGYLVAGRSGDGFESVFLPAAEAWDGRWPARLAFAHRRLSIIDLSDRGRQPMTVPGSGVWIVFNGEIYNYVPLRRELEALGRRFLTRTDTEVLLHAYLAWGDACLERLEGMFAFAIWDAPRGRVFCARDRLGIKPFYYARTGDGTFYFASEMKSLLASPAVSRELDHDAVVSFLVHGNCDYGERTTLAAIRALPGGHSLTLDLARGVPEVRRYWRLAPRHANGATPERLVAELKDLLLDTTRAHLQSDVQVGSCLSGGLDSSTVVSLAGSIWHAEPGAATAFGDRFHTFTSCYPYADIDEREYALAVARAVGATPELVFPTSADFWADFARMAWHQDMPFGGLSFYAQWRVMRAAREAGVKVLLDGQGGDEVFGGYAKFRYAYLASLLRHARLAPFARELAAMVRQGDLYVLDLRRGFRYLPPRLRQLLGVDAFLAGVLRDDWHAAVRAESTPATRWWRYASGHGADGFTGTSLQRIQVDDLVVDTLPQLLRMEDRSSMAFSLEARVPLLDHRVVERGLSLPDQLKVHGGWSKFAVRQAMAGLMPEMVRWRRSKLGFAAPDRRWLVGELREPVTALLDDGLRAADYVDPAAVRRWYERATLRSASTEAFLGLFRVLSLEMWMRAFDLR